MDSGLISTLASLGDMVRLRLLRVIEREELSPKLIERIQSIYAEDERLYQRVIRERDVADFAKTNAELQQEIAQLRGELDERDS